MSNPNDIECGDWLVDRRTVSGVAVAWCMPVGDDEYVVERGTCVGHDGPVWQAYIDGDPIGPPHNDIEDAFGEAETLIAKRSTRCS